MTKKEKKSMIDDQIVELQMKGFVINKNTPEFNKIRIILRKHQFNSIQHDYLYNYFNNNETKNIKDLIQIINFDEKIGIILYREIKVLELSIKSYIVARYNYLNESTKLM